MSLGILKLQGPLFKVDVQHFIKQPSRQDKARTKKNNSSETETDQSSAHRALSQLAFSFGLGANTG